MNYKCSRKEILFRNYKLSQRSIESISIGNYEDSLYYYVEMKKLESSVFFYFSITFSHDCLIVSRL